MNHSYRWLLAAWLLLAGAAHGQEAAQGTAAQPAATSQIEQAQALIKAGKAEAAFDLLEPLETELAGNVQYDYLLGMSALNSGQAGRAVFAFERVQAADPQYQEVGLWLSIAYYQSGDRERARPGFEGFLAQSRNPESQATAEHYLALIDQQEAGLDKPSLRGKVEAGLGYDSNITNSSLAYPGTQQLFTSVFAPGSSQGGAESILNLGVEGRVPVSERRSAFVSVDQEKRWYSGNRVMNSTTLIARGGMNFASDGDTYRLNVARREFRQLGTSFATTGFLNDYSITGVEGSARWKLSGLDYVGLLGQLNQLRFAGDNTNDVNQIMAGANYMHLFRMAGKPVLYLGYARAEDAALRTKAAFNPAYNGGITQAGRRSDFFTVYLQYTVGDDVDIYAAGYLNSRRDAYPYARDASVAIGNDQTRYVSLGLNWRVAPSWSVRPQLAATSNSSNIAVYTYNKTEATVLLRRDFR